MTNTNREIRKYNNKPNSTSFKVGHKKIGGFVKGSKHTEKSKELESLRRALDTIDRIASVNNEDGKNMVLTDIYKIAHAFSGRCSNPHNDWKEFEKEMAKKLENY